MSDAAERREGNTSREKEKDEKRFNLHSISTETERKVNGYQTTLPHTHTPQHCHSYNLLKCCKQTNKHPL